MTKKRLAIIGFIVMDVLILMVLLILLLVDGGKTAVVDVLLAPANAVVTINGESYSQGTYKTYPGKTVATISAEGFKEKNIELDLNADNTTIIHEYLMPDENNLDYYANNNDDAELLSRIGGEDAQKMLNLISIKDVLPIIDFQYGGLNGTSKEIMIDQDFKCAQYFCLMVTGDTGIDKKKVEELIKKKGYNPEDYSIRYELH